MNIEDLRTMVKSDLVIDENDLHTESLNTPQLHNKYLIFHENSKLELEKLEFQEKISLQKSVVDYLEEVVKIVSSRQWNIKSAIEWIKFTQGI